MIVVFLWCCLPFKF